MNKEIKSENSGIASSLSDVSLCHTLIDLTDLGKAWLDTPVAIGLGDGTVSELSRAVGAAFHLTNVEGLAVVVGALSLAVGPGVCVQNPFGSRLPLSLQIWTSAENPNFDRALRYLCQGVVEAFAGKIGRGIEETDKNLMERLSEVERDFAREEAKKRESPWPGRERNSEDVDELTEKQQTLLVEFSRLKRKRGTFPFGDIITPKVIARLVAEERDFCFGSFSPDGSALRHLLAATAAERQIILRFINSGFLGELFTHNLRLPIFPIYSALWLCDQELLDAAISGNLHCSMPGALVIAGRPPDKHGRISPLPPEASNKWKNLLKDLERMRLPVTRRFNHPDQGHTCSLDPKAVEALSQTVSWGVRFAVGSGYARTVFARSPEQILKIAGLLSLESTPPDVISVDNLLLATEIFRWLVRGTFETVTRRQEIGLAEEIEMFADKLRLRGPLTLREIVRAFHRMPYPRANQVLLAAIRYGRISMDRDVYRAVES